MSDLDQRKAILKLRDQGLQWKQIGEKFGRSASWAAGIGSITDQEAEIIEPNPEMGWGHVKVTRAGARTERDRLDVLKKAVNENLTQRQTGRVAKAISRAEDEDQRQAVLATPIDNVMFDRHVHIRTRTLKELREADRRKFEGDTKDVKEFIDRIKEFEAGLEEAEGALRFGKFSPEAKQFCTHRLEKLIVKVGVLIDQLN